jgi:hypothetical protein
MKKQYIFLLAAIAVLSAYLALRSPDKVNYELPDLPDVQKKDITAVEMEKQGHRLVLKKDGGAWKTEPDKYPASDDQVDRILDAIVAFTLTDMVSQTKSYDRFDLTDDKKTTVRVFSGDKLKFAFDMGSIAGTRQHTFVRISGDDRVYHARGNLRDRFTADMDDVRDKTVMMFNPNEIREVRLGHLKEALIITRVQVPESPAGDAAPGERDPDQEKSKPREKGISWKRADGQPVDEAALERLLSTVTELKCQKYIYDRKKDAFADPRYSIAFTGARTYSLFFFPGDKEKPEGFPAISSENSSPFILTQYKADEIIAGIEAMMKPTKTDRQ